MSDTFSPLLTFSIQLNRRDCEFYIQGSVHRDSILIRSNEIQQYAGVYLLQKHSTLHVSGVQRTHHQEYIKL